MKLNNIFKLSITIIFFSLLSACICCAEDDPVILNTKVSTATITIGDRFTYTVSVVYEPDVLLSLTDPSDALTYFEIKDYNIIGPKKEKLFSKKMKKQFFYTLSTFTTGQYIIPAQQAGYKDAQGEEKTVTSKEIIINVLGVTRKPNEPDDIRDIKSVLKARYPAWYYWTALAFILILGGAGAGYYLYKTKKLPSFLMHEPEIIEPPHITAFRRLNDLKNSNFLDRGQVKQYYIILSETLKMYLEKRYSVPVLDRTTYEVYYTMREADVDKKLITKIKEFLEDSDLVKFAKYIPDNKSIQKDFDTAYEIVDTTKEEEVVINEQEEEE
ncbi:hypothetical protein ACFL4S_00045 [bacterium]